MLGRDILVLLSSGGSLPAGQKQRTNKQSNYKVMASPDAALRRGEFNEVERKNFESDIREAPEEGGVVDVEREINDDNLWNTNRTK